MGSHPKKLGEFSMDTTTLAHQIAQKVIAESSFWIAIVGMVGVLFGALITIAGNLVRDWLQDKPRRTLDEARKKLLLVMLNDMQHKGRWRKFSTLSRVIGADDDSTKRLLIEVGARSSEKDDGLWGLIEHHPLAETDL
jgi:hypothetical protein